MKQKGSSFSKTILGEVGPAKSRDRSSVGHGLERANRCIFGPRAAVPVDRESDGAQNVPAMCVGDRQRQTAIGVAVRKIIHPLAGSTSRHNLWWITIECKAM